jgi:hypothetical protein
VVLARGEAQRILNEDPDLTSNVGLRDELGGMAWDDLQIVEAG